MDWFFLIVGGLFEAGFAFCLGKAKESSGLVFWSWLGAFFLCLLLSMLLLYKAVQTLPVGTAYAVWTGIGAAGAVVAGVMFFKEPLGFWRIFFLCSLIASIAGLKFLGER